MSSVANKHKLLRESLAKRARQAVEFILESLYKQCSLIAEPAVIEHVNESRYLQSLSDNLENFIEREQKS